MAQVGLIPVDAIPSNSSRHVTNALLADLTEQLREALRKNQALIVRLGETEGPARFSTMLRKAADHLGVVVLVTGAEWRPRVNRSGRTVQEAAVLYARITKAAGEPVQAPAVRRPITIPPARFEKTVLPGVEVSR